MCKQCVLFRAECGRASWWEDGMVGVASHADVRELLYGREL